MKPVNPQLDSVAADHYLSVRRTMPIFVVNNVCPRGNKIGARAAHVVELVSATDIAKGGFFPHFIASRATTV